jgi:hypothetical protein
VIAQPCASSARLPRRVAVLGGGHGVIGNAADAHVPWFAFPLCCWRMFPAVPGVDASMMKTAEQIMVERSYRRRR